MKTQRRSLLYFPSSKAEWYKKLPSYDADVFVFDLEDAVKDTPSSKSYARKILLETKKPDCLKEKEFFVRINSPKTEYFHEDLDAVLSLDPTPDAILLPKVESAEDVRKLETILEHYETIKRISRIEIVPTIETLIGEKNAEEILTSSRRITTLQFGENGDYTASYGSIFPLDVIKDPVANDFLIKILKLAKLYNLLFIDGIYFKTAENEEDIKELERRCKYIKLLGGNGKGVIHPSQIPIVNEIFSLDTRDLEEKKKLIEKYERHLSTEGDSAYFKDENVLIGPTYYKQAKRFIR